MTGRFQPRSTTTTAVAMRFMPFQRISSGPVPSSARSLFTAGPKTRPARRRKPKARRSHLICDPTVLRSIDWPTKGETSMTIVSNSCNPVSRRLTLGLAAALLAVPALLGSAKAASMDEIKSRGLIVATEDDFRPFEFVKDGKATGFDNELIEDMRKAAPFEINEEIIPWTGI